MVAQEILTLLLISAIVVVLNSVISRYFYTTALPYYWGSKEISDKRTYLYSNRAQYNAIFLGSSKTQNQINSQQFDRLALDHDYDVRSYNFGVGGLTPLESLHIYENLLVKDSLNFNYAFIELDWIATINLDNLNTSRSVYWLTSDNYSHSIRSILHSSVPVHRRAWGIFHYSWDYMQNAMNVGKVNELIKFNEHQKNQTFSSSDSNIRNNGFIPMYSQLSENQYPLFEEVISSAKWGVNAYSSNEDSRLSGPFLNRLQQIDSISRAGGIELYFIVPLQWKHYQYDELVPIIKALGSDRVICLFDFDKYQDIYKLQHFADPNHLNNKGASLYTAEIFSMFNTKRALSMK